MKIMPDDACLMVVGLIYDLCTIRPEKIEFDYLLEDDLGLDVISILDLSMALEDTFNIIIHCDDMSSWESVHDVVKCVERLRA